jgi:hypothetical protein
MTGTDCGLFTHKSVPVIFEPPCIFAVIGIKEQDRLKSCFLILSWLSRANNVLLL